MAAKLVADGRQLMCGSVARAFKSVHLTGLMVEGAVASLGAAGMDAQLGQGGRQVARAAAGVSRLVLVQRCGQRRGEVKAGQIRERPANVEGRRDAVCGSRR